MAPKNPNSRFRTRLAKPENGDENGGKAMACQRDININEPLGHNHGWFYVLLIFGHPSHHGNPQTIGSLNNFMGNLKNSYIYIYICCINIINGFITIPQSWKQPISWRNHRFLRGFAASDAKFWTERIRPRVSVLSRRVSWVQHSWRSSLVRLKILRASATLSERLERCRFFEPTLHHPDLKICAEGFEKCSKLCFWRYKWCTNMY